MRVCPRCRTEYSGNERFCHTDSSVLVEPHDIERLGTTVGNYFLQDILGRGGMGTVFRGEHIYIQRKVAVKILHSQFARYPEAVGRFLREARAATSINHPNIVDVTDFGPMPHGGVFFVMEYLEGTSLEDVIERENALELHRGLNVANQISLALAAAHQQGIIHRDLKPDNIMLIRRPGRRDIVRMVTSDEFEDHHASQFVTERENTYDFVKVLDFGIAKVLTPDELGTGDTLQGAVFGTPEYMSPEAARGEDVDHRSDIYSLGVILFDMVTGRPPFEAEAANDVLQMQIHTPPPSAMERAVDREITPAADQLIRRAMAKDPAERHQSMEEFRDELQGCFGSVAYRRNARSIPGAGTLGPEARRRKRLTEELDEWLTTDAGSLSLDEARQMAAADSAEESFALATPSAADATRISRAIDAAIEDEDPE